jgi:hypothetical protein
MPLIVLPSVGLGGPLPPDSLLLDFLHVFGIMCFPGDEVARDSYSVAVGARLLAAMTAPHRKMTIPLAWLRLIADAPPIDAVIEDARNAAAHGAIASMVLGYTLERRVGLGRAFEMVSQAYAAARLRGGDSETLRKHIWPARRSTAHLWCAFQVWVDSTEESHPLAVGDLGELYAFFALSEHYRRRGEAFAPRPQDGPILRSSETWRIDPELCKLWPDFDGAQFDQPGRWDLRTRGVRPAARW